MTKFMIRSPILDRLSQDIRKAVEKIHEAINNKRPILIRHHADCDGYAGALALERAILSLMYRIHRRESDIFFYYRRLPSRTPFYDYSDATKDLGNFLQDRARFERKAPLIIVVDNGSSREDLLALKKVRLYNAQIIVIDHHPFNEENSSFVDVHINPYLVQGNSQITAGMIGAETAHILNSSIEGMELLAAVAGVADRSENEESSQYIGLAQKKGFSPEYLRRIAEAIDFEVRYIGYMESRYLVDDLFFGNTDKQQMLIAMIENELQKEKSSQLKMIEHYADIDERDDFIISSLDISKTRKPNGHPLSGKITSMMFDMFSGSRDKPIVALGHGEDFITFRISRELEYDVNEIIAHLDKELPYALIVGGGHPKAGTVRFIPAAKKKVMKIVLDHLGG